MGGLGVDLGTTNTVVCDSAGRVVLDEPSVMVFRVEGVRRPKMLTVGREARELVGRLPVGLTLVRPLQDGVITDLELARMFIRAILRRLRTSWPLVRHSAAIGVPAGATNLERRALLEAAEEARIGKAWLVPQPIAGAAGCGIDPLQPRTHLVIDIGGGTAEVTAFSFGGVLTHRTSRVAGDEMTAALGQYLRRQHQIIVGELLAGEVKIRVASEEGPSVVVEGKDAATGRPRLITLGVDEVAEALRPITDTIVVTLAACLDDLTAQGVSDVASEGILAFGGGSLMRGFDKVLEEAFGFSVRVAERPLTCVAEGAARCLRNPALLDAFARV